MLGHNGFFVFSGERSNNLDSTNIKATNEIKHDLKVNQINHREVIGGYKYIDTNKVEREISFIVAAKHEKFVLDSMNVYNQESVLYVDGKGNSYLIYKDHTTKKIGKWNEVDSIKEVSGFTFCPVTDTYWTVK